MNPVAGNVTDPASVHALAQSGSGWLNRDGRTVSKGSLPGTQALRALPETAELLDRLDAVRRVAEQRRKEDYAASLKDHVASGEPEETFYEDRGAELVEILESEHPHPDVPAALMRAGWFEIELRQDNGVREVHCPELLEEGHEIIGHLRTLAEILRCRLSVRVESAMPSAPIGLASKDPRDYDHVTPEMFANIPEITSYDPKTRVIHFVTGTTVTLPGGLDPDEAASADHDENGPVIGR